MKNHLVTCVACVAFLATVAVVPAQAQSDQSLIAKIPFAFWVQEEKFSAGEYVVEPLQHGYLRLRGGDRSSVILHVLPNYSRPNVGLKGKLVFNRYGEHYFLREAWIPTTDFGMDFMRSKVEIEMAKHSDTQKELVAIERR